LYSRR
jgi:hypothetical protein